MPRYAHSGPTWVEISVLPASQVIPGAGIKHVGEDDGAGGYIYVEAADDLTIDPDTAAALSDEDRAAYGIAAIVEPGEDQVVLDGLVDVDGAPHRASRAKTLDERKALRRAELAQLSADRVAAGFPCPALGAGETLQVRDSDLPRWLALRQVCRERVDAGDGAELYPIPLRSTANVNHPFDYATGLALMDGMLAWWDAVLATSWAHADAIRDAADAEALAALDLTAGWPS